MGSSKPVMLVIDDDPTFCHLMEKVGEREHFKVISYSSVEKAYRDLPTLEFDVAVLDFNLGRVTGAQLSNYMKGLNREKPILLVSSGVIEGTVRWSEWVEGTESKKEGAYKVFLSAMKAFDQSKAKRNSTRASKPLK